MPKFKECYSGMWLVGGVVAKGVFERGVPEPSRNCTGGSTYPRHKSLIKVGANFIFST